MPGDIKIYMDESESLCHAIWNEIDAKGNTFLIAMENFVKALKEEK